jgi:hypothetical protein
MVEQLTIHVRVEVWAEEAWDEESDLVSCFLGSAGTPSAQMNAKSDVAIE